ncbi:MAG: hypothetical protein RRC07_10900 [Anaerolineae bacterium]|nr:hypothetical protein [Anaerolineae bacterium]
MTDSPPARTLRFPEQPMAWAAAAFAVYAVAASGMWLQQSLAPHYIHLADALNHGQLHLLYTENLYDLLLAGERAYVAGSPLPAVLLMPLVALLSNRFSDILFSIIIGAINVGLVQAIFRRPWLTILFALATPHLYMAALGSVWLTAHLVALLFALPALYFGWRRERWFLAGLLLGLAGLARPSLWFGSAFFGAYIWLQHRQRGRGERFPWRPLLAFSLPVAAGVAIHLAYNAARFGSPLDFGYGYTAGAPNVVATYNRYGGFNPRFLSCNLSIAFLNPPIVAGYVPPFLYRACSYLLDGVVLGEGVTGVAPNPLGMSLLLATPAFLLLLGARGRRPAIIAGWAGMLAVMVPLWSYHNTGSAQFGYRYWMDAAPFWLLLLALSYPPAAGRSRLDGWLERLRWPLLLLSLAISVWGFLWIYRLFVGHSWFWETYRYWLILNGAPQ